MKIAALHPNFVMPTRGSVQAAGYDLTMPTAGSLTFGEARKKIPLGFATEIPEGYAAILMPRSGAGSKGVSLANTFGLIDADYRGEWMAMASMKEPGTFEWSAGHKLFQFFLVPVFTPLLQLVDSVEDTARGDGGFGSTGK